MVLVRVIIQIVDSIAKLNTRNGGKTNGIMRKKKPKIGDLVEIGKRWTKGLGVILDRTSTPPVEIPMKEKIAMSPAEVWTREAFDSSDVCYLVYWFDKPSLHTNSSAVLVGSRRQWIQESILEIVSESDYGVAETVNQSFKKMLAETFNGDIRDDRED